LIDINVSHWVFPAYCVNGGAERFARVAKCTVKVN